jgi:hypothetical protein
MEVPSSAYNYIEVLMVRVLIKCKQYLPSDYRIIDVSGVTSLYLSAGIALQNEIQINLKLG